MIDYEKLYYLVFNTVTDAIGCIDEQNYGRARLLLVDAQQKAEAEYINDCQPDGITSSVIPFPAAAKSNQ